MYNRSIGKRKQSLELDILGCFVGRMCFIFSDDLLSVRRYCGDQAVLPGHFPMRFAFGDFHLGVYGAPLKGRADSLLSNNMNLLGQATFCEGWLQTAFSKYVTRDGKSIQYRRTSDLEVTWCVSGPGSCVVVLAFNGLSTDIAIYRCGLLAS